MLLNLYLVRHGETAWSLSGQHTGRTEIPLTERGEARAQELGVILRSCSITRVLTSPRQRAQRTCALAGLTAPPEIDADLAEWDYGDYEGRLSAEILGTQPDWNLFRDGCPNGETPAQVCERADRLIARLRLLEGNVALFTHGHFGRVFGARWIGLPLLNAQNLLLNTASLSMLGYEHNRVDQPVISLWNATPHELAGLKPIPGTGGSTTVTRRAIERWENEGGDIPPAPRPQPTV